MMDHRWSFIEIRSPTIRPIEWDEQRPTIVGTARGNVVEKHSHSVRRPMELDVRSKKWFAAPPILDLQ
jgi:hypothetical protein